MRTTPTITLACRRYAGALELLGSPGDAAALLKADTWQMIACCLEDVGRYAVAKSGELRATAAVGGNRHAVDTLVDTARGWERLMVAGPWLIAAVRGANVAADRTASADLFAYEALRLLGAPEWQ